MILVGAKERKSLFKTFADSRSYLLEKSEKINEFSDTNNKYQMEHNKYHQRIKLQ